MSPKRKPDLSVTLIGAPHDGPMSGHGEDAPADDGATRDDAKAAMEEFIAAVHAKDTEAALTAYESLHDFCAANEDEEDASEDEAAGERDLEE